MNILVIGSGGREHALCWKIKQSSQCSKLYCAPGNAGTAQVAENVAIKVDDIAGLLKFVRENKIDLTIVGPELPLVLGIVDLFEKEGLKIIGPSKQAAQLEGSKLFSKKIMKKYGVPTAAFAEFTDFQAAKEHLFISRFPVVIKADGLAAGKGVCVAKLLSEGIKFLQAAMQDKCFGEAGNKVIIEEFLQGEEASILAFVDGKNFVSMPSAQDHKPIYDNDEGPNTGGMGAYSPAPVVTKKLKRQIDEEVFKPMVEGMAQEGMPYQGILYAGLMITDEGPKVVEFNVRFGDPETQAVVPRLETDLVEIFEAIASGNIKDKQINWKDNAAVCVVLAVNGYPGKYKKGEVIKGLDQVADENIIVFQAGAKKENDEIITDGGRVLSVTAVAQDIGEAIKKAYQGVKKIEFKDCYYRKDIGKKAAKHLTSKVI